MAKFAGLVGYVTQEETVPGVWVPVENPKQMRGDVIRQNVNIRDNGKINGDVSLQHRVSVIGDAYAFDNYYNIKWIMLDGMKWEVTSIEVRRPRIIVSIGGLYNG